MEPARLSALLARTPGLAARHLLDSVGGAGQALPPDLLPRLLESLLPPRTRAWLECPNNAQIDSDLRWLAANDCRILSCVDADFPAALMQLAPAPPTLYVAGDPRLLRGPQLAVVGSRRASVWGIDTAYRFAAELARAGLAITSGLAEGIDTAAHEGALAAGGPTIGVCGPD